MIPLQHDFARSIQDAAHTNQSGYIHMKKSVTLCGMKVTIVVLSPIGELINEALKLCQREATFDYLNRLFIAVGRDVAGEARAEVAKEMLVSAEQLDEKIAFYADMQASGLAQRAIRARKEEIAGYCANLKTACDVLGIDVKSLFMDSEWHYMSMHFGGANATKATAKKTVPQATTSRLYGIEYRTWLPVELATGSDAPEIDEEALAGVPIEPRNKGRGLKRKALRAAQLGYN